MTDLFTGSELVRPFIPSKDLNLSKQFYQALGFEMVLDAPDVVIFNSGSGGFLIQKRYQKEWAENFMMQLMVDDLDVWWEHISALDLPSRFGVPASEGTRNAAVGASHRLRRGSMRGPMAYRPASRGSQAGLGRS